MKLRDIILCLKSTYCTYVKNKILKKHIVISLLDTELNPTLIIRVLIFSHCVFSFDFYEFYNLNHAQ